MKPITVSLCLLFALAVYVPSGFITAAYVQQYREPPVQENLSEYWRDRAAQQHHLSSCAAGAIWPIYWATRGATWAINECWEGALWLVTPCPPTELEIAEAEADRLRDEWMEMVTEPPLQEAQDSIEMYRELIQREREKQAELDREREPWPWAHEGRAESVNGK